MKRFIAARIKAGDTKSGIERKLVAQFGPAVIAEPPKHGFGLVAWLLPIVALLGGAAVLGAAAWRWSRTREPALSAPVASLDPDVERRIDEELARFEG